MPFKSAKIFKEGDYWQVEMTHTGLFWGECKRTHEFESYELALTFLARERCKGEVELPKCEE